MEWEDETICEFYSDHRPDRPFHNFRALNSESSPINEFWGFKILKGWVSQQVNYLSFYHPDRPLSQFLVPHNPLIHVHEPHKFTDLLILRLWNCQKARRDESRRNLTLFHSLKIRRHAQIRSNFPKKMLIGLTVMGVLHPDKTMDLFTELFYNFFLICIICQHSRLTGTLIVCVF